MSDSRDSRDYESILLGESLPSSDSDDSDYSQSSSQSSSESLYIYMGYSNGQLESEVKGARGEKGDPGLPGIGFKLTDDGNFDIDEKRLTDLGDPIDDGDATTKNT